MGKRSKLKAKLNASRPNIIEQISGPKPKKIKKAKSPPKDPQITDYINENMSSKILKEASLQTQEMIKDGQQLPISLSQQDYSNSQQEYDFCREFVSNVRKELTLLDNDETLSVSANQSEMDLFEDIVSVGRDIEVEESLRDHLSEIESHLSTGDCSELIGPEAMSMYERVGKFLSIYRAGPIPKGFKVIPCFANWVEILKFTNPTGWTAAAMYEATRIFVSRLPAEKAQIFLSLVLLPRVRDDIKYYKKLNFHIFRALKKALFKPAAFFKGILLPLCCDSPDFTLKEATLISGVLSRASIPVEHSAAALIMLTNGGSVGGRNVVIKALLEKRYALPYQTVDCLVAYFVRCEGETTVLWHCALLEFIKHYARDFSDEQVDLLWGLLKNRRHPKITPVIRSFLTEARRANCSDSAVCCVNV